MPDGSVDLSGLILPKPRTLGLLILALLIVIIGWGTFVLIPAGHRGVVLLWGSVENRIMGEGLNFKTPMAESVIKVDVKVQPHPFKEIDASSKEYQIMGDVGSESTYANSARSGSGSVHAARFTAEVVTPRNRATAAPECPRRRTAS